MPSVGNTKPFKRLSERAALLSPMELSMAHPLNCDRYFPINDVRFNSLYSEAQFELTNLALFHRAAFDTVRQRDEMLDQLVRDAPPRVQPEAFKDDDDYQMALLFESRRDEAVDAADNELAAIAGHADELCVIGLWAHAEKFLGEALRLLTSLDKDHRWDKLLPAFQKVGLDLSSLPGFLKADECRQLNNALKHGGLVTPALATLTAFQDHAGERLRKVELDVQSYLLAIHHLVGATLERSDQIKAGHDNVRPYRTDRWGKSISSDPTPAR